MARTTDKDVWERWWPRFLSLSGLAIVVFIVLRSSHLDPYVYPLIALMLGFPVAGLIDSFARKRGGNGNGKD